MTALAPQLLGARVRSEPAEPLNAQPRGVSPVSPAEPSPTLPQTRTGYTQPSPKCSQHSDLSQYPRNSEGSSPHSAYNEKSSPNPALLRDQHGHDAQKSNSGDENDGKTEPWAWSGRRGKRGNGYDTTDLQKPYMRPAHRNAARENDNPEYRDDTPKRGDNVTSNKRNPPLMKELGLGASQQAPTTKDDQCGAQRGSRD
jgi:hypothetical protein